MAQISPDKGVVNMTRELPSLKNGREKPRNSARSCIYIVTELIQ